jgi:hypothetical protein
MDKTYTLRARSVISPLVLLPALVVGLSLAFTGAASAQTAVPFQASVDNISTNGGGNPGPPCPTNYYCGTATIPGHGLALWWFDSPGPLMGTPDPTQPNCYDYTGTSNFTLNDAQLSTLALNEDVTLCHPGNSFNTPNFWTSTNGHPYPWGHPSRAGDAPMGWTVCNASLLATPNTTTGCGLPMNPNDPPSQTNPIITSTGVFSTLTGGSGTDDSFQTNGAILTAAWSGTLTFGLP